MNTLLQLPVIRTLKAKGLLFVVVLLPVVAGVLLAGALEEEATPIGGEEPRVIERPTPGLLSIRPDLEKTPLSYQADYWAQLADGAINQLVLIGPDRVPGLVMDAGYVLTSTAAVAPVAAPPEPPEVIGAAPTDDVPLPENDPAADSADEPQADDAANDADPAEGEDTPATTPDDAPAESTGPGLLAIDWDAGLALFELGDPATATPFELGDETELHPGSFTAAVTRTITGRVQLTPGYFSAAGPPATSDAGPDVAVALPDTTLVAALIDLDGGLVGAAFRRPDGVDLLSTDDILDAVTRLSQRPVCYPILTTDVSEEIYSLFDITNGVAVERVRPRAFPAEPAIRPGDVLLEWNDELISSVDQFQELYRRHRTGDVVEFVALRGTRRVTGSTVVPDRYCRPYLEDTSTEVPRLGLALIWSNDEAAWDIAWVTPTGAADVAGLLPDDRILTVNGRELAERNVVRTLERLIQREPAIVFTIQRGERARLLAITPSEP